MHHRAATRRVQHEPDGGLAPWLAGWGHVQAYALVLLWLGVSASYRGRQAGGPELGAAIPG